MKSIMRRLAREESGAFAIIFALCLIALVGMMVLVVDVGGLLYQRRQMVSASDAAALAAAQSCALGAAKAGVPGTMADQIAHDNVPSNVSVSGGILTGPGDTVGCETDSQGHVTVQYTSQHPLWFAGIFGSGPVNVTTKATAEWGEAGSGWPVPFIVTLSSTGNVLCKDQNGVQVQINDQVPIGTKCYVWFDNNSTGGGFFGGFGNSVFGSLNLNKWDVAQNASCSPKDLPDNSKYASKGGYDNSNGPLDPLNYPAPTWVCVGEGNVDSLYSSFQDAITKTMVFPITDGQVVLDPSNSIDKFNVVGFAALRLDGVHDSNQTDPTQDPCPSVGSIGPANYSNGSSIDLVAMATGAGCGPFNHIVSFTASGDNRCCRANGANRDYNLVRDASGNITGVNWLKAVTNVSITMVVEHDGVCGPPEGTAGHCLAVSWQGAQLGNGPFGGNNVGVPAVRLCDPSLDASGIDSCDTLS